MSDAMVIIYLRIDLPEDLFLNRGPIDWLQSQCLQWLVLPMMAVSPGHTMKCHCIPMINMLGQSTKSHLQTSMQDMNLPGES